MIGAGGWGYFGGGLRSYARGFSFVEVNSTFYRRTSEETARRWRKAVPPGFVFSVKAHQEITHRARLQPTSGAQSAFADTLAVARALRAPFVVLQAPESLPIDRGECETLRDYASLLERGTRLGLEPRAHAGGILPAVLERTMLDSAILDVVDVSKGPPRLVGDVVYTRLFGAGTQNIWQFDDAELRSIDRATDEAKAVAYAFHGVRMYNDAARFLTFRRTGRFPAVTSSTGLDSFVEVLATGLKLPASRDELVRDQGWKVFDLDRETRAHASKVLAKLPDREFSSLSEIRTAAASLPAFGE
jgi:uncharacterized protein YecE (DUF72 family)